MKVRTSRFLELNGLRLLRDWFFRGRCLHSNFLRRRLSLRSLDRRLLRSSDLLLGCSSRRGFVSRSGCEEGATRQLKAGVGYIDAGECIARNEALTEKQEHRWTERVEYIVARVEHETVMMGFGAVVAKPILDIGGCVIQKGLFVLPFDCP